MIVKTVWYRDCLINPDKLTWEDIYGLYGGYANPMYKWLQENAGEKMRFLLRHTLEDLKIRDGKGTS